MHPPRLFQIDGNFGFVHGVNEMLAQIEKDTVEMLPALPSLISNGEVKGQKLRGGYTIDFKWENGKVTYLKAYGNGLKVKKNNLSDTIVLENVTIE